MESIGAPTKEELLSCPHPTAEFPQIVLADNASPSIITRTSGPAAPAAASVSPALAAATDCSPAAVLAASLVRSRATYFERLTGGPRASTSAEGDCPQPEGGAQVAGPDCAPTLRPSTALASQPLHPLAPHPLSAMGKAGAGAGAGAAASSSQEGVWQQKPQEHRRRDRQQRPRRRQLPMQQDSDLGLDESTDEYEDDDAADSFFDKPSYTCYGAAVELSPASSYAGAGPQSAAAGDQSSAATAENSSVALASAAPASTAGLSSSSGAGAGCGGRGYVRSMSAHFARVSSGSVSGTAAGGRGGGGVPEGLFDDLVAHMGALLASHPDMEAQMGVVQGLSDRLLQLHAVCETLGRKEDEVEHLRGVLRELTTTRAEAIRLKVQMAESLNGLQQEYYKVLRSAQLAQGTCKQHSARAATARKQLLETQGELLRYKRAAATLRDRNRRLRAENEDMATRLAALEGPRRPGGEAALRSASYLALLQAQTPILY